MIWDEMAVVGRIARAHGNRGQVIVNLETDFPDERFQPGAELFIERNRRVEALRISTVRFQRERPVIGIEGIETMNDAEALAGYELRVPVDRLAALPGGTFYRHDLIGCRVETQHGQTTLVELFVPQQEIARVIGRQGRTAAALRTLASVAGERDGKQVTLEIREGR